MWHFSPRECRPLSTSSSHVSSLSHSLMFTCPLIIWFRSGLQQQRKVRQLPTGMWMGRAFVTVEPTNTCTETNTHPHRVSEYAQWLKHGLELSWVKGTLSFMLYFWKFLQTSINMSITESRAQRYANFKLPQLNIHAYTSTMWWGYPIKHVLGSTFYHSSQRTNHFMGNLFRDQSSWRIQVCLN